MVNIDTRYLFGEHQATIFLNDETIDFAMKLDLDFEVIEPIRLNVDQTEFSINTGIKPKIFPLIQIAIEGPDRDWRLESDADWLKANWIGTGPRSFGFGVMLEAEGEYEATVTLTDLTYKLKKTVKITGIVKKVNENRLIADTLGVALNHFPGMEAPTKKITIKDDLEVLEGNWTASSSVPWLAISDSGALGSELEITANPELLEVNTLHTAEVTVASENESLTNEVKIKVAFWVGAAKNISTWNLGGSYKNITSHAIMPFLYANNGQGDIDVFHLYFREKVGTIAGVGQQLGAMKSSLDGSHLYAFDNSSQSILAIDLSTESVVKTWSLASAASDFDVIQENGQEFLITNSVEVINVNTDEIFSINGTWYNSSIATSKGSSRFCRHVRGISPSNMSCYELDFWNLENFVRAFPLGSTYAGSNGRDVAVSLDGKTAYAASGAPYKFNVVDINTMTNSGSLDAEAYPTAIEVSSKGDVIGAASVLYGPKDVWVYGQDGSLKNAFYLSSYADNVLPRALAVSGDGDVIATITEDNNTVIVQPINS